MDERSIQETINALVDQKRKKEKLVEYREKNWDIWLELPWTIYSSGYYQPRAYIWDEHWTPAHEYSNERWNTCKILVKSWNPWDSINFYRRWTWYTVYIDEDKRIDLDIQTSCRWNNNQEWWYDEMDNSIIQPWQIFINGVDVYQDTVQRIKEKQREWKEKRKSKFNELKDKFLDVYSFSESEFNDLCKYAWKWNVMRFLSTVKSMLENSAVKKDEIISAMVEIKYPGDMVFRNYLLIKRKARKFKYDDVKRVIEKGYARKYLTDNLPWVWFVWYFGDAMWALKLALDQWLFRKGDFAYTTSLEPTISDLWQALIDAGIIDN